LPATQKNFKALSVTPGPTCLSEYTFKPIPSNELTENIVFAVNKGYAVLNPDWRQRAQEVIDYVNKVLSQNTRKQYRISKFLTYPTSEYATVINNKSYYVSNGAYGGTTFFYYVYDGKNIPKVVSDNLKNNALVGPIINGQQFYAVMGTSYGIFNILLSKSSLDRLIKKQIPNPTADYEGEVYNKNIRFAAHELGHTLGLSFGEWYFYNFADQTNMPPKLGRYNFNNLYPRDPMVDWAGNFLHKFSEFNAALINLNANHQYSYKDIAKMHAPKAIVRVKDASGNPVRNATVKVFGARKNAIFIKDWSQPLLQSLKTDSNGIVEINNVDSNFQRDDSPTVGWIAKIIKVSKGGENGGAVFTLVDSQISYIINKSRTHYIDITIN